MRAGRYICPVFLKVFFGRCPLQSENSLTGFIGLNIEYSLNFKESFCDKTDVIVTSSMFNRVNYIAKNEKFADDDIFVNGYEISITTVQMNFNDKVNDSKEISNEVKTVFLYIAA